MDSWGVDPSGNCRKQHTPPAAMCYNSTSAAPAAHLSLDKTISTSNSPGKAEIKYMDEHSTAGPKQHSSTYTSQMMHQTAAIRPLTHEEPFRESVSHGLCVFGYWLEESYQQQMKCSGGYSSDKGRWVRRSQRGGWRGSWRGRSLSGHAPPTDSIPCFHAYREAPPPAPARRPSGKARERSSQWSHSPRTPADGERRVSVWLVMEKVAFC